MSLTITRAGRPAVLAALASLLLAAPGYAEEHAADKASEKASEVESRVIKAGSKVSIEYTLKLDDGTTIDTSVGRDPLVYTQGSGQVLPGLEAALVGLSLDDSKLVKLSASDAYGEVIEEAFREMDIAQVPEEARKAGAMLLVGGPNGEKRPVRVVAVNGDKIVIDFNHPLAGKDLTFDVKIVGVE